MNGPSAKGVILSGLIMAVLPILAIANHRHVENQDVRFEIPAEITPRNEIGLFSLRSEMNVLDLTELSGTDGVKATQTVYIHMATGPDGIAYPFGISRERPSARQDGHAFSVRGTVTSRTDKKITVRYNYESFVPSHNLRDLMPAAEPEDALIELAVNSRSVARLTALKINGVRYPYRVMERPELTVSTH